MTIHILEGLALILFAVRFLRKGLDRLFGSKLADWLSEMTGRRWQAFAAGIGAGTVAPSSTALSFLSVHMLQTGRIRAEFMLAVLLGSGVGMTITAQLLATGLVDQAGWFLIVGVVSFQILRRDSYRGVGQCLLALGFLFLGLHEISRGAGELGADPEARGLLAQALGHPVGTVAISAVLAVLLQSSTASIGLSLGLAAGGLFPPAAAVPWVVGTNLGVSFTSLLVGWKHPEGRRLGAASLLARAVVAVPVFLLGMEIWNGVARLGLQPSREIGMLQTGFNLLVGVAAVPFLEPLTAFVRRMLVDDDAETEEGKTFLDEEALESPSLALAQATRQTQAMVDRIESMLRRYRQAEATRNTDLAKQVQKEDDVIDTYNCDINLYLSRIGEGMGQDDAQWQFALLGFSNELESVGDLIDKHLCDSLIKRAAELVAFTPVEEVVLAQAYETVAKRLRVAAGFLAWRDTDSAKEFLEGKDKFNDWCRHVEKEHFLRLKSGEAAAGSGAYFLDVLNSYRRINSHISSIGYAFEE